MGGSAVLWAGVSLVRAVAVRRLQLVVRVGAQSTLNVVYWCRVSEVLVARRIKRWERSAGCS